MGKNTPELKLILSYKHTKKINERRATLGDFFIKLVKEHIFYQ